VICVFVYAMMNKVEFSGNSCGAKTMWRRSVGVPETSRDNNGKTASQPVAVEHDEPRRGSARVKGGNDMKGGFKWFS